MTYHYLHLSEAEASVVDCWLNDNWERLTNKYKTFWDLREGIDWLISYKCPGGMLVELLSLKELKKIMTLKEFEDLIPLFAKNKKLKEVSYTATEAVVELFNDLKEFQDFCQDEVHWLEASNIEIKRKDLI